MRSVLRVLVLGLLPSLLFTQGLLAEETVKGPLADYVAKADKSYKWVKRQEGKIGETSFVELTLTSQIWKDIVWKHQLFLIKPSTVAAGTSHAMLFISGGSWKAEYERPAKEAKLPREATLLAAAAEQMKTPVAVLLHVPQQPIMGGKVEDQIIALTFERYLRTKDPEWPLLLPMVKSAVRGMDATAEFAAKEWSLGLKSFTVTGASKRGWTTWLTAAVDKRVTALAPMVIDTLNMGPQMKLQVESFGDYSEQIRDYTERGLQKQLMSEGGKALREIIDPYSYRKVLKQPKLILLGTNDRYWPLDALNLYWNDLEGDKYVLYCPNNGHGLKDYPRLIGSLIALQQHAAFGKPLPKLKWSLDEKGGKLALAVDCDVKPSSVKAWIASSATRDFREAKWTSQSTRANGKGHEYAIDVPRKGFAAMFGEATFDEDKTPFYLSTNVKIVKAPTEKETGSAK